MTTKDYDFLAYPDFSDVTNDRLRAYNRVNVIYNIKETVGNVVAVRYAHQFDRAAKVAILNLHNYIKRTGYSTVRREILRSV